MQSLKVLGLIVGAILLMAGSYFFGSMKKELDLLRSGVGSQNAGNNAPPSNDLREIPQITYADVAPINDSDHIYGNKDAKLALVEYSDFECPFCKTFHPTAKQLVDESNGEIKWIFRHLPIVSIHPNAMIAAIGSECVTKLLGEDAFWGYSETLMSNTGLNKQFIIDEALALGVDEAEFNACLEDPSVQELITNQDADATATGIRGTPGNIIINTESGVAEITPGALPLPELKKAFDAVR